MADAIQGGNLAYAVLEAQAKTNLAAAGWVVDYIEVRHADSLDIAHAGDQDLVILAAARLGNTRLIDNVEVHLA